MPAWFARGKLEEEYCASNSCPYQGELRTGILFNHNALPAVFCAIEETAINEEGRQRRSTPSLQEHPHVVILGGVRRWCVLFGLWKRGHDWIEQLHRPGVLRKIIPCSEPLANVRPAPWICCCVHHLGTIDG